MRGRDIVFLYLWYFVVLSRGFFFLSCWFWQFVTGCFWEFHILKRARTPVWALKALIWRAHVKVKGGHPGTIVDYFGVIRIPRVSSSDWAGLCEYLAGSTLTFLGVEALLFTVNLWCVFRIYFLVWVTRVLKFFSDFFFILIFVETMPFLLYFGYFVFLF